MQRLMTCPTTTLRALVAAATLGSALLIAPTAAEAAKLKLTGGNIAVDDDGVAAITVKNPNRSRAKGKLSLKSGTVAIGSRRFNIGPRRSARVGVQLILPALEVLAGGDGIQATATARAKGKGISRKSLVLYYPPAVNGNGGGDGTGGGDGGGQTAPAWSEGRYQGTYATNSTNLAFNVVGNRLYTGPFDAFYIEADCGEDNPDATAIEPVEATIGPDGNFHGTGTYRPSATLAIPWEISGHISGTSITNARFSVSYTNYYGHQCSGSTDFTANWYGSYTAKPVVLR